MIHKSQKIMNNIIHPFYVNIAICRLSSHQLIVFIPIHITTQRPNKRKHIIKRNTTIKETVVYNLLLAVFDMSYIKDTTFHKINCRIKRISVKLVIAFSPVSWYKTKQQTFKYNQNLMLK